MIARISFFVALALVWAMGGAVAADSRIRTVTYTEDHVVDLLGVYGYQVSIEFPDNERIENVAVGDSVAWQVTPNKSATALFVKPVEEGGPTNMTVVTSVRRYSFAMEAARRNEVDEGDILFVLRFEPAPEPEADIRSTTLKPADGPAVPQGGTIESTSYNREYSYTGSREIIPSELFDDGKVTYFQWPDGVEVPAIFLVGADDRESIVNYAYAGDFVIVDRVARAFSLRRGSEVTRLFNDGFVPIDPGPNAPAPRAQADEPSERRSWLRKKGRR